MPSLRSARRRVMPEINLLCTRTLFCYSYWNCKCKENRIQHISVAQCYECGVMQDDRPPAKLNEVVLFLKARAEADNE
jgi:hypothetical protein